MAHEYQVHLNFLPVGGCFPNFAVYRKPRVLPQEPRPTSVSPYESRMGMARDLPRDIHTQLELSDAEKSQVAVQPGIAKEFLEIHDLARLLLEKIPKAPDAPF